MAKFSRSAQRTKALQRTCIRLRSALSCSLFSLAATSSVRDTQERASLVTTNRLARWKLVNSFLFWRNMVIAQYLPQYHFPTRVLTRGKRWGREGLSFAWNTIGNSVFCVAQRHGGRGYVDGTRDVFCKGHGEMLTNACTWRSIRPFGPALDNMCTSHLCATMALR